MDGNRFRSLCEVLHNDLSDSHTENEGANQNVRNASGCKKIVFGATRCIDTIVSHSIDEDDSRQDENEEYGKGSSYIYG